MAYVFTFHNVSINTLPASPVKSAGLSLHSTMFLLIHIRAAMPDRPVLSLHSTMFLLILGSAGRIFHFFNSLHSTMFLLILVLSGI